jgi:DNA-binding CsgD family transcriptional regulator
VGARLTDREIQILRLIGDGFEKSPCDSSFSVKTVEYHGARLYARIGVTNIAGAVRFAIRKGYLTDG